MLCSRQERADRSHPEELLSPDAGRAEPSTMERVPKGQGLEPSGRDSCDLERGLDRIRAACREEDLGEIAGCDLTDLFRKLGRHITAKTPGREGKLIHLLGDRSLQARMAIADVMDGVAVKIHVAASIPILDPDAFRLADGAEARGGNGLMDETCGISRYRFTRVIAEARLPFQPSLAQIGLTFGIIRGSVRIAFGKLGHFYTPFPFEGLALSNGGASGDLHEMTDNISRDGKRMGHTLPIGHGDGGNPICRRQAKGLVLWQMGVAAEPTFGDMRFRQ